MAAGNGADVQQRDPFAVDVKRALEALRLAWGVVYDISFEGGKWTATRKAEGGETLTADTPDQLVKELIKAFS